MSRLEINRKGTSRCAIPLNEVGPGQLFQFNTNPQSFLFLRLDSCDCFVNLDLSKLTTITPEIGELTVFLVSKATLNVEV